MKRFLQIASLFLLGCNPSSPPTSISSVDVINLKKSGSMVLIPAKDSSFTVFDTLVGNVAISLTKDFYINTTEITQKMYSDIMNSAYTWYKTPSEWAKYRSGASYPAYGVTWFQAILFCNARSKLEGLDTAYSYASISWDKCLDTCMRVKGLITNYSSKGYRLPTEAEWMYACKSISKVNYFWGTDTATATQYCWYQPNSQNKVNEVSQKHANQFGLYDMLGNVDEYCNDYYAPYPSSALIDPTGPTTGQNITKHGGSFYQPVKYLNFALRQNTNPESSTNSTGFRTVRRL